MYTDCIIIHACFSVLFILVCFCNFMCFKYVLCHVYLLVYLVQFYVVCLILFSFVSVQFYHLFSLFLFLFLLCRNTSSSELMFYVSYIRRKNKDSIFCILKLFWFIPLTLIQICKFSKYFYCVAIKHS
jgi:hypothetical protein